MRERLIYGARPRVSRRLGPVIAVKGGVTAQAAGSLRREALVSTTPEPLWPRRGIPRKGALGSSPSWSAVPLQVRPHGQPTQGDTPPSQCGDSSTGSRMLLFTRNPAARSWPMNCRS